MHVFEFYLFTLEANIVGVFPQGIFLRLLVEFGGGRSDCLALCLVLVFQSQQTLPLDVVIQINQRRSNVFEMWMGNGLFLKKWNKKTCRNPVTCTHAHNLSFTLAEQKVKFEYPNTMCHTHVHVQYIHTIS